ncbi:hypothetical protein [Paractinoplanes lichenicola]|uniref:Transmembrane transport protein n=1 Tax=Paractinoplanes lichenicola TaxID=2802976 RepID=A0ABS1VQH2_9ACTN|nr:hypothetical protein [Actinoplanes lichenicola]MBL7256910.1 hypothetical protein [Actinoplanes lichenicola]
MTPEDVLGRLDARLSPGRRIAYVVVALAGLVGSALIGLLWATEPALPTRTGVAFAVLIAIGLSWTVVGTWAVTRRTPLFARDRVVAGWLGLAAWAVFAGGALIVAPGVRGWPFVVVGALGVAAVVALVSALRTRSALLRRKAELGG